MRPRRDPDMRNPAEAQRDVASDSLDPELRPEQYELSPALAASIDEAASVSDRALWGSMLLEIVDVLEAHFRRRKMPPDAAAAEARAVVMTLATHWGGRMLYLPKGDRLRVALKHQEIWRRFDGRNARALAEEFQMSIVAVYRVIDAQRRRAQRDRQPGLFAGADQPVNRPR